MTKDKKYEIQNSSNYFSECNHNLNDILKEFINIFKEYIHYFSCYIKKNDNEKLNIITKGFESISHIFIFLILYTKNLELAIYHTKKSYLYYYEFISQIGDENNSFLKLNCKDAILFIYKKTIFEINTNKKKEFIFNKKNKIICETLKKMSSIIKNIYFYNMDFLINNYTNSNEDSYLLCNNGNYNKKKIEKINDLIMKLLIVIYKKYNTKDIFEKISKFIYTFENQKITPYDYIFILKGLLKKKCFINIALSQIDKKINNKKIHLLIKNKTKFIQFICSHKQ
tara:strand:- start:94 stop:942 length:849 start_codon:yes stop_codon:yes gene_type:complete